MLDRCWEFNPHEVELITSVNHMPVHRGERDLGSLPVFGATHLQAGSLQHLFVEQAASLFIVATVTWDLSKYSGFTPAGWQPADTYCNFLEPFLTVS